MDLRDGGYQDTGTAGNARQQDERCRDNSR